MSGRTLIWPNPSPRKVGGAVRTKNSPILPKTEFFNSMGGKCAFAAVQRGLSDTARADLQYDKTGKVPFRDASSGNRKSAASANSFCSQGLVDMPLWRFGAIARYDVKISLTQGYAADRSIDACGVQSYSDLHLARTTIRERNVPRRSWLKASQSN